MNRKPIDIYSFNVRPHHLWNQQYMLLASGDFKTGDFNCMTVGWGSLGTMWGRPFAQVVVRPTRYTYGFMERFETFTLTAFPEAFRDDLDLLGTKSGRDGDKMSETGLTPIASKKVAAPVFAEAELVLECRKMYWEDMNPERFLDESIHKQYPGRSFHRIYYGEILHVEGASHFIA